jgi:hypothetical protein
VGTYLIHILIGRFKQEARPRLRDDVEEIKYVIDSGEKRLKLKWQQLLRDGEGHMMVLLEGQPLGQDKAGRTGHKTHQSGQCIQHCSSNSRVVLQHLRANEICAECSGVGVVPRRPDRVRALSMAEAPRIVGERARKFRR